MQVEVAEGVVEAAAQDVHAGGRPDHHPTPAAVREVLGQVEASGAHGHGGHLSVGHAHVALLGGGAGVPPCHPAAAAAAAAAGQALSAVQEHVGGLVVAVVVVVVVVVVVLVVVAVGVGVVVVVVGVVVVVVGGVMVVVVVIVIVVVVVVRGRGARRVVAAAVVVVVVVVVGDGEADVLPVAGRHAVVATQPMQRVAVHVVRGGRDDAADDAAAGCCRHRLSPRGGCRHAGQGPRLRPLAARGQVGGWGWGRGQRKGEGRGRGRSDALVLHLGQAALAPRSVKRGGEGFARAHPVLNGGGWGTSSWKQRLWVGHSLFSTAVGRAQPVLNGCGWGTACSQRLWVGHSLFSTAVGRAQPVLNGCG